MRQRAPEKDAAPARVRKDDGEEADDHQLPGAHTGANDTVGETGPVRKGAAHQQRNRRDRGNTVSDREDHAKESEHLPGFGKHTHQAHANGTDEETADQDQTRFELVCKAASKEHAGRGDEQVNGDGQPKRAAANVELFGNRPQDETDGKSRATPDEQDHESDRQRDEAVHARQAARAARGQHK